MTAASVDIVWRYNLNPSAFQLKITNQSSGCTNTPKRLIFLYIPGRASLVQSSLIHLEMADIASETALQHLESLYPHGEVTSSSEGNTYETRHKYQYST